MERATLESDCSVVSHGAPEFGETFVLTTKLTYAHSKRGECTAKPGRNSGKDKSSAGLRPVRLRGRKFLEKDLANARLVVGKPSDVVGCWS